MAQVVDRLGAAALGSRGPRRQGGGPNYNPSSLALCLIGNLNLKPPTGLQLESGAAVLRWWRLLWPAADIPGHGELPGLDTDCPGRCLDMDGLWAAAERG